MTSQNQPTDIIPIPSIGVGGLLFNKHQQVLLIKRNQPPAKGLWSLPGGRLEPGETLVAACRREYSEETNLDINVKHIVALVERKLEGFHYVIIDYFVELVDEEKYTPIAQSDVADAKWINLNELAHYDIVEGLLDIIIRTYSSHANGDLAGLHNIKPASSDYVFPDPSIRI
ncbi:MAG: NUDIX hydrolase [Methyloglobulus sp.]|nr:NUDIX hydrolase [Methyloglobulus sp.]